MHSIQKRLRFVQFRLPQKNWRVCILLSRRRADGSGEVSLPHVTITFMERITRSLDEFGRVAADFALRIKPCRSGATVIGLCGELGAGKTAFVQAAARALGVTETLTSPTFLIFKKYQLPVTSSSYRSLVHADAYRLKNSEELRKLRFNELLADPDNLIFVEWADRVADMLPSHRILLTIAALDDQTRAVTVSP